MLNRFFIIKYIKTQQQNTQSTYQIKKIFSISRLLNFITYFSEY